MKLFNRSSFLIAILVLVLVTVVLGVERFAIPAKDNTANIEAESQVNPPALRLDEGILDNQDEDFESGEIYIQYYGRKWGSAIVFTTDDDDDRFKRDFRYGFNADGHLKYKDKPSPAIVSRKGFVKLMRAAAPVVTKTASPDRWGSFVVVVETREGEHFGFEFSITERRDLVNALRTALEPGRSKASELIDLLGRIAH